MIGGLLLATGGVAWNYGLVAAGTFITLLPLLSLPALPPPPQPRASVEIITGRISFSACQPAGGRYCAAGWFIDDGERGAGTVSGAG